MSGAPGVPNSFNVQTGNGVNLVSWAQSPGATSYVVQRSFDNVTYTTIATVSGSPLATQYLDSAVLLQIQYWYQVQAVNGSGSSSFTQPQFAVPTTSGEMSLGQIRLQAQQRADRVNSNFVTLSEWNNYINQAMFELYDLLVTLYEDYYIQTVPPQVNADGTTFIYTLPTGFNTFVNSLNPTQTITPPPMYKLTGVDLALNNAVNAWVTVNKFNFVDRNRFVYPNTASTIYGVFNLQYRLLNFNQVMFIPTPSAGQGLRFWYVPRLRQLLLDTDTTITGISGWIEYVIVRAAKYALDKEESDTSKLGEQIAFLKTRIEESAANRDAGMPDKISDTSQGNWSNGWFSGNNGSTGGWAMLAIPIRFSNYVGDHLLTHTVRSSQLSLTNAALSISLAYLCYLYCCKFGGGISFSGVRDFISRGLSSFFNHIMNIIHLRSKKEMSRVNTPWVVTGMTDVEMIRNRAFEDVVRHSGRGEPMSSNREPRSTVVFIDTAVPFPARMKRNKIYSFHESFFDGSWFRSCLSHISNLTLILRNVKWL